jgi:hypothetical protein
MLESRRNVKIEDISSNLEERGLKRQDQIEEEGEAWPEKKRPREEKRIGNKKKLSKWRKVRV